MPVSCGVTPGDEVLQLPLDVAQEGAGAKAEQVGMEPTVTQLILDHGEPVERLARGANPARGLEPDELTGSLLKVTDRPSHDQSHRESGIDALLTGRRLDEIGT